MFTRFAGAIVRYRRAVLAAGVVVLIACFAYGGKVSTKLNNGGFNDPNAPSTTAENVLQSQFHTGDPNLVFVVTARTGTVNSPAVAAAGRALTARLAAYPDIQGAGSYWSLGDVAPLRSVDGRQALVLATITGNDDQTNTRVAQIDPAFVGTHGPITVTATGQAPVFRQVGDTIRTDLARSEEIAIPITLVLLIFVFGSVVAAAVPLAVGGLAVGGTFAALTLLVSFTKVSIFSLNLTTALGLGLAIDYSLFVVNRFREELAHGREPHAAVVRTMQTAGRTVLFSAATVAASLAALLVFPLYFLRSFAYAGIAVVIVAAAGAVVVLPALLAVLGTKVDSLDLRRWLLGLIGRTPHRAEVGEGFWHRLATFVMRFPVPIATAIIALLLFLGVPFLGVHFGQPDDRVLPTSASTRAAADDMRANFTSGEANAFSVVAPAAGNPSVLPVHVAPGHHPLSAAAARAAAGALADNAVGHHVQAQITAYAEALSLIPEVARVDAYTGSFIDGHQVVPESPESIGRFSQPGAAPGATIGAGTWLSVVPVGTLEAQSPAGEHLIHEVRDLASPWKVYVGGGSAQLVDSKTAIFAKVPWALGIIALVTFVTLFLMFGSILVPIKAVVLNLLSLTATFGAMVWIFQEGHGSGLLHFTATGTLDTTTPILMFCIAFGLSMDYEVFLLSRIKEEHDRGADTTSSVAIGLERTGRIVTAAAALLAIVFLSFATSEVTFIKLFGLGLTLAVLMDATLIRGTLVPAFMRLAGNANWWAPGPLRRVYQRFGISESDESDAGDLPVAHDEGDMAADPSREPVGAR